MFEYQGKQYTLEDLQRSATQQGYDNFDEFMQLYKDDGMVEVEQTFEPIQFEQQVKEQEISSWQSFKNNIYNTFEMVGDIGEFYTSDEGAGSSLDIATTLLYEAAFGKEKIKEWRQTDFGQWFFSDIGGGGGYEGSDTESFRKSIEAFEEEQQETKRTMTFKEADSIGDYLSVASGAVTNVGGSVVYNLGTLGSGFFMQFASENFITANEEKAKANNTTIDNLLKSGDHDVEAPIKIAAFQAGLELFGFSKIIGKTGVGKKLNKKVGEYLTKNYKTSKNIRTGLDILGTGRTEAFTEMGQTGLEIYNKELAVAKGKGEDINDFESIVNGMFSEDGIEAGLQGFFGGAGLKGGAYSAKALNSIRSTEKTLDVEKDLNSLVNLTKRYNSSKDEDVRFAINEEVKTVEKTIKNKIKKGNDIYNSLSNKDIKNIENITDLSDVTAARAISLIEKFKNKQIPEDDFNIALKGLTKKYKEHKENILKILYEKNIQFAITEGEKIGKEVVEIESLDEFQKKYNEIRTEGDFEGDVTARDGFIKGNKIFINKQTALKEGAISVGSHELLHGVIGQSFDKLNLNDKKKLGKSFIGFLNKEQEAAVRKRLKESYGLEGDAIFETEEIFTAFSDAITKNEITFNETIFQKIGLAIQKLMNKLIPGYKKEFKNGRQAYEFLKEYQANVKEGKLGERVLAFAEQDKDVIGAKFKVKPSLSKEAVDQIKERVTEIGLTYNMEGGKKLWDEGGSKAAIDEITKDGLLDDLIASKYKVSPVPENFVKDVLAQLLPDIRGFNPEENNDFGGYLGPRINFRAGDVYKDIYEKKGPATVPTEAKTKEGEVKVQVKAEKDVAMKELETKDVSIAAQIKEAKAKKEGKIEVRKESEFRRKIGIETGSDLYNKVLETARKVLLRAYKSNKAVRQIQRDLRNEANLYLFKDIKNFLGTKQYVSNLKKFRESIIKVMFTSDLVQMEREVADNEKVFTKFVKKLTTLKEVQNAVDQMLLPPSALNVFKRDKSVNLYEKTNPTEPKFLSFFDIPIINPVTGARSGKRGTRKDQLAKYMSGALTYDATLEVAQESEVAKKRQQIAELNGETVDDTDIQVLSAAIDRNPNIKFSKTSTKPVVNKNIAYHLNAVLQQDKVITKQDFEEYSKNLTYQVPGQGVTIDSPMNDKDRALFAREGFNITNAARYERTKDKNLQKQLIKGIEEARQNGQVTNSGLVHEETANKNIDKNTKGKLTKGSGDAYISYLSVIFGIEHKLSIAQWVSRTLNPVGDTLSFTTKNDTIDQATGKPFENAIIKKVLEVRKEINNFLSNNNIETIKDFNKPLSLEQRAAVKAFKSSFQVDTTVSLEYVMKDYVLNKYADNNAQSFLNIEGGIHLMETDSDSYRNAKIAVDIFNLGKPKNQQIKNLKFTKNINNIDVHISLQISEKGIINHRLRPKLNSDNFEKSNVNIYKDAKAAKGFGQALDKAAEKIGLAKLSKSAMFSRSVNNPTKGITVLDFDDTLATTQSLVKFTRPDGTTGTLNAEQYASTYEDLLDQGFTFDFTEFNKVVKGKIAPLFQKALKLQGKFGPKNMFVLTARPPAAANAIHVFLKANGLNIPLKNITGLANSTAEAKALWIADKVGEGYNDFYFADDALQNVQAVENILKQLNVKRKVQRAVTVKFSKSGVSELTGSKEYKSFRNKIKNRKIYHGGTKNLTDPKVKEKDFVTWFYVDDKQGSSEAQTMAELWGINAQKSSGIYESSTDLLENQLIVPDMNDVPAFQTWVQENYPDIVLTKYKGFDGKQYESVDIISVLNHKDKFKILKDWIVWTTDKKNSADILDVTGENLYDDNGNVSNIWPVIVIGKFNKNNIKKIKLSEEGKYEIKQLEKYGGVKVKFSKSSLRGNKAVKNMLDQLDVKSKVQQAKVKFSRSMNDRFNDILENITGIESKKRFSIIKGRKRGESKGKFRFFIPPSHEDFVGLLYNFMGKGKEGNKHRDFFEQALVRPLNRGYREIDTAKQAIANDYKSLNKKFPEVKDKLIKATPDGDFTFQDAIRVYLWNKHGHKIPGLTETDQAKLTELVMNDPSLQAYAETLNVISKQENYVAPGQAWETANIRIDLIDATGRVGRANYFTEFNENAEVLFSEENLNKIEAGYGRDFREALEDMLHRIKTGVNRPKGASGKPNMFMNWLNASVSGVMFFNTRSALLQQMSNVNFLNFADNNIFKAGLAFANQPQYWKDFAMIFNSDMLKQRRGGLGTDINGAELAEAIKKARPDNMFDQVSIIVGKALKLGFLPTQIGDNIAIATGGAAFYRNRVNKYLKDGMSVKQAEDAAFTDLQNITQSTQQSARPDMTSAQQASWIGKLVLNFLNTPSQYNRIIKKAGSDIKNRRITPPNTTQTQSDMSNASRILYYGAAQNLIFYSLQTALFAVMFGDDDEENEAFLKKKERVINGTIDTLLRGSGIYGVAVSTLKNMTIKFLEQREKGYNKDESAVIMELANFSPVVGIKLRKVVNAEKTLNYNKKVIDEMETFDIDNPQWSAVTNYVEAITTAPTNRIYQKTINLRNAADNQYTAFQRALFFSGYTTWSLDLGDTKKMKDIKESIKTKKKEEKKKTFKPKKFKAKSF